MTRRKDNRTTRLPAPAVIEEGGALPDFTPVPSQTNRHDGWTPERQREFIEALADTGSVEAACRHVNMTTVGAYRIRRLPEGASFRAAWDAALDFGVRRLEDVAMERALNGVEEPFYVYGEHVGTRKKYNDRLLMFMLRNRSPERFGVGVNGGTGSSPKGMGGLNAVGKMEKRRLKRKWRKQWEAERAAEEAARKAEQRNVSAADIHASITRKAEAIRRQVEAERAREWEQMSEETRAAWARFVELRDRDFEALKADEDFRRTHERGPKVYGEWAKPQERRIEAPEEPGSVDGLKDDGWE